MAGTLESQQKINDLLYSKKKSSFVQSVFDETLPDLIEWQKRKPVNEQKQFLGLLDSMFKLHQKESTKKRLKESGLAQSKSTPDLKGANMNGSINPQFPPTAFTHENKMYNSRQNSSKKLTSTATLKQKVSTLASALPGYEFHDDFYVDEQDNFAPLRSTNMEKWLFDTPDDESVNSAAIRTGLKQTLKPVQNPPAVDFFKPRFGSSDIGVNEPLKASPPPTLPLAPTWQKKKRYEYEVTSSMLSGSETDKQSVAASSVKNNPNATNTISGLAHESPNFTSGGNEGGSKAGSVLSRSTSVLFGTKGVAKGAGQTKTWEQMSATTTSSGIASSIMKASGVSLAKSSSSLNGTGGKFTSTTQQRDYKSHKRGMAANMRHMYEPNDPHKPSGWTPSMQPDSITHKLPSVIKCPSEFGGSISTDAAERLAPSFIFKDVVQDKEAQNDVVKWLAYCDEPTKNMFRETIGKVRALKLNRGQEWRTVTKEEFQMDRRARLGEVPIKGKPTPLNMGSRVPLRPFIIPKNDPTTGKVGFLINPDVGEAKRPLGGDAETAQE